MIYSSILRLENLVPSFNREPFTPKNLLSLIKHFGAVAVPDNSISESLVVSDKGRQVILYNPCRPESRIILNIGHEIGHIFQGHLEKNMPPMVSDIFAWRGIEKDAGIFGFLFWLPTIELCKMLDNMGRINIEEVYRFATYFDPDITEDEALKLCTSRIRIFEAWRRMRRFHPALRYRLAPQSIFPFRHEQMVLPF